MAGSEIAPETNAARGSGGRGVVGPASRPRKTSRSEPNAESFSAARERLEGRGRSRRAQRPSAWLFSRNEGQRGGGEERRTSSLPAAANRNKEQVAKLSFILAGVTRPADLLSGSKSNLFWKFPQPTV